MLKKIYNRADDKDVAATIAYASAVNEELEDPMLYLWSDKDFTKKLTANEFVDGFYKNMVVMLADDPDEELSIVCNLLQIYKSGSFALGTVKGDGEEVTVFSAGSAGMDVSPEAQTTTVLGKLVSALQSANTAVSNAGVVSGTLNYVTGYTGYSGDPTEQAGNFLALKVGSHQSTYDHTESYVVKLLVDGVVKRTVTLDSDKNLVVRVTDKNKQKLVFEGVIDGDPFTKEISLTGLTLTPASE